MRNRYSPPIADAQRSAVTVGLLGIGLIHTLDLPSKWHETPYLGLGYVLLIGASLVAAGGVIAGRNRRWAHLAVAVAAIPLAGYVVSRTVGLPAATGDIGNWLEPLGLASLFVEGAVLLLIAQCSLSVMESQSLKSVRT